MSFRSGVLARVMTEDLFRFSCTEGKNIIAIDTTCFHAGRTLGHSGHGQSPVGRCFHKQSLDVIRGHMALYDITAHFRRMAGKQTLRHTKLPFVDYYIRLVDNLDLEPVVLQMLHPFAATTTRRILVDRHIGKDLLIDIGRSVDRQISGNGNPDRCKREQGEQAS